MAEREYVHLAGYKRLKVIKVVDNSSPVNPVPMDPTSKEITRKLRALERRREHEARLDIEADIKVAAIDAGTAVAAELSLELKGVYKKLYMA